MECKVNKSPLHIAYLFVKERKKNSFQLFEEMKLCNDITPLFYLYTYSVEVQFDKYNSFITIIYNLLKNYATCGVTESWSSCRLIFSLFIILIDLNITQWVRKRTIRAVVTMP